MTPETYHNICDWLATLLKNTAWNGQVYAVGGCCRDEVMGREINDVDLAVNLCNGGIGLARWLYENGHTVERPVEFERYGTAMLRLAEFPEYEIEIVQTRCGKYTSENAQTPGCVFGTVEDDAMRRDFTVNSLYYDISAKKLLDVTGYGLDDIKDRRLRTPMPPEDTFFDDPVRILRCIRLASEWGWKIDKVIISGAQKNLGGLKDIKPERRRGEFEKMLCGADPMRAMKLMRGVGVMTSIIPELTRTYKRKVCYGNGETLWNCALHALRNVCDAGGGLQMRMAALLHVIGAMPELYGMRDTHDLSLRGVRLAEACEQMLRRLHYHHGFLKEVLFMLRNQYAMVRWGNSAEHCKDRTLKSFVRLCVNRQRLARMLVFIDCLNNVASADAGGLSGQIPAVREKLKNIVKNKNRRNGCNN